MANWCSIKVVFDEPVPPETLDLIFDEMLRNDYDFPWGCLHSTGWCPYRSPMDGGEFIPKVFLKHGAKGQFWITGREDADDDSDCSDQDVVVFRPGLLPDSIANLHRAKVQEECIQRDAESYVEITRAFGIPAIPVVWEAAALVAYILITPENRPRFEAAVEAASHD